MEPHRRLPLPLLERPPPARSDASSGAARCGGPGSLGWALLPLVLTAAVTGFLSHAAYDPDLGRNHPGGPSASFDLYFFDWPSSPAWLYALTQGLHVISGIAAIPLLLAKLWSVIPKLFEWPPVRSITPALERLSLAFLVGGSLFVLFTGVLNIQLYYPWKFNSWLTLSGLLFGGSTLLYLVRRTRARAADG